MNDKNQLKLSKEKKEYMISEIKTYFLRERQEEIGDLASILILDFIIEKLAPEFFNQGIAEAHKYMTERLEDLYSIQK
ncbi:MAG: DUF2164 domain-containing protein [Candidatus Gastranaerophilaceae bacterium]|jgi:uncharacterized protein (DUF2164 family)